MGFSTKQGRLNSQTMQFESLIKQGYTQEVYKGLNIFTQFALNRFYMKIFKNSAAHSIANYYYRTEESRDKAIQQYKDGFDRQQTYKAELKANPVKSSAANTSSAVKEELTNKFPGIKFSVTSSNFAGGNSVDVSYTDGPTTEEINNIIGKYQYGHFDGMTDMYENTNDRDDIPQAKYVHSSRQMSKETEETLLQSGTILYIHDRYTDIHTVSNFIYRIFYKCSIPAGAIVTGFEETGKTCGLSCPSTFYKIGYTLPETKKQVSVNIIEPGELKLIDYSDKSFAVIGETKPIKDTLKQLGGSFNPRLTCGMGWIFPKTKVYTVRKALNLI